MTADSLKKSRRLKMNHLYIGVSLWLEVLPEAQGLVQKKRVGLVPAGSSLLSGEDKGQSLPRAWIVVLCTEGPLSAGFPSF